MAENIPNLPTGGVPPRAAEAAKVQPKKETVRINLPPKPTASPTIKLPTLPAGGPPPSSAATAAPMAHAPSPSAPPPSRVPAPPTPPPPSSSATRVATQTAPARPANPTAAPATRQAPVAAVSGLDKALAISAAVVSLIVLGTVIFLWMFVTNQ